jgi:hypothetical protein
MTPQASNRTLSKLLLTAYILGFFLLTLVTINPLHRFWTFIRVSIDACSLVAGYHLPFIH